MYPIITRETVDKLLKAKEGLSVRVSLDIGKSVSDVKIEKGIAVLNDERIELKKLEKLKEETFYIVDKGELKQIAMFSEDTNLFYKLHPSSDWPTIKISSVPMHRHIKMSPKKDTESKIKEIAPVKGKVLDTCCGLGYTAIMSAKFAEEVHTFERDKNVLHVAGFNPYSQELFSNKKIRVHNESVYEGIRKLPSEYFDRIIHDPPTFKISPELYTREFYKELYRVLKKGGIIYHYAPWPGKTKGKTFYHQIERAIMEGTPLRKMEYHDASSGLRIVKE